VRVAEVDVEICGQRQVLMISKLLAAVLGQHAPQVSGQMLDLCGQRCDDGLHFLAAHLGEHHIARAPLDQRGNEAVLEPAIRSPSQ